MLQARFLQEFNCLGDRCEDTCCKGWGMQVDESTFQKYQDEAPELLDAVTSGEAEHIMKRDPKTDYCVKFDNGWCGIHRDKGTGFLGDACHFFPRVTRKLGDTTLQTASLSCPEVARLTLMKDGAFEKVEAAESRLPFTLRNYAPAALTDEQALKVHTDFLTAAGEEAVSAERFICRLYSVAESMKSLPEESWPEAVGFYMKMADGRLAKAEVAAADPFNLFHALVGLVSAARKSSRKRLDEVIHTIQRALNLTLDENNLLSLAEDSLPRYLAMQDKWLAEGDIWQPMLKRWIQGQLSLELFPFAGLGETVPDRALIIAVRFATVRLALMAQLTQNGSLTEEDIVRIAQSIARFLDHLADPTLSLQIYAETGWNRPARLRGLLELEAYQKLARAS